MKFIARLLGLNEHDREKKLMRVSDLTNRLGLVGKGFLCTLISVALILLVLESILRLWGYADRYISDPIYMSYDQCDAPIVTHKPNLRNAKASAMVLMDTDSLGLRTINPGEPIGAKAANVRRIAVVGDSYTFGHGIRNTADVYPTVLQSLMNSNKHGKTRYEVFNFGVAAYSLAEMAATLRCRMLQINPDIVVCAFIFDDFDLTRTGTVNEYGYTDNRRAFGVWTNRLLFLKHLLRKVHLAYLFRDAMLGFKYRKNQQVVEKESIDKGYEYLLEFKNIAVQNHIDYFFVLLPTFGSDDLTAVKNRLDQDALHYLDLSRLWNNYTFEEFCALKGDAHPSVMVHREIASKIADYIQSTIHFDNQP